MRRAVAWVRTLEKPVGIMASFDPLGRQILQACRLAGVEVPDEAAVVGVDDDELLCNLAEPPLSSVAPDTHRTGYVAASLLDRLMNGEAVEPRGYFVEPIGIAVRKSSDMLAIDDHDISSALRYIRENACRGISVGDILPVVPLGRRALESRFTKLVGRSPHDEIERVRLNRVQELLRQTDLSLAAIAAKTGFAHEEYLSVLFKKRIGLPPSAYRRRHGLR
jgi:LacI family transcriptional regulator